MLLDILLSKLIKIHPKIRLCKFGIYFTFLTNTSISFDVILQPKNKLYTCYIKISYFWYVFKVVR